MMDSMFCAAVSGSLDVGSLLPAIGSGYKDASVQRVLDMAVSNNFSEGYDHVEGQESYTEQEIGMGCKGIG